MLALRSVLLAGVRAPLDHVIGQARAVAQQGRVATTGVGARHSYMAIHDLATGALLDGWHLDRFGIVRQGMPNPEHTGPPVWVAAGGDATKAYPLLDVFGAPVIVLHQGQPWRNTVAGNHWEPGAVAGVWVPA